MSISRAAVAGLIGIVTGWVLVNVLPLVGQNILFLASLPLMCMFALVVAVKPKVALIILLLMRLLIDPLLYQTTIGAFGAGFTLGAGVNLALLMLAGSLLLRDRRLFLRYKASRWGYLFLAVCVVSIMQSPVQMMGIKFWLNLATYVLMLLFPFSLVRSRTDQHFWVKVLVASSFLPIGYANAELLFFPSSYIDAGMRIKATFSHPNVFAFYVVVMVAVVFYVLKTRGAGFSRAKRLWLRLYLIDLLVLLAATKTRSAWVACWSFFVFYGFKEKKYLVYALLAPCVLLLAPTFRLRVEEVLTGNNAYSRGGTSLAWRIELWRSSLIEVARRPFFGYGLASFLELSRMFSSERSRAGAHNVYLQLLFETGLCGLACYGMYFIGILTSIWSKMQRAVGNARTEPVIAFAYVGAYLLVSVSDNVLGYLSFNWYYWFFLGLLLRGMDFEAPASVAPATQEVAVVERPIKAEPAWVGG
jgi:O-antigen ligase